jgi:hypothetical protein
MDILVDRKKVSNLNESYALYFLIGEGENVNAKLLTNYFPCSVICEWRDKNCYEGDNPWCL